MGVEGIGVTCKHDIILLMIKTKKKTTTEIICENLNLPKQIIFQDYKCTLESSFSFFGRLYIAEEHLMFVSNMFGFVKKIAISIESISKVLELPNDKITITGKCFKDVKNQNQEFVFAGFKNNNAFRMINALWKKEKLSLQVLNTNEEEAQMGQKQNQSKGGLDESNMEINLFNPEMVQTEKQKMVEIILPCSLDQFYRFFLADNAQLYPKSKHFQFKNATKVVVTPWKKNEEMNAETRQITAIIKVKGVPFKSETPMTQIWLLTKRSADEINLKTTTQVADIPYSSYFTCEQQMIVSKQGQTKCKFTCSNAIIFNKPTYMKNTILSKTFADLKQDYNIWIENVKEKLEKLKKNVDQSEKKKARQATTIDVQFQAVLHQSGQRQMQFPQLPKKKQSQTEQTLKSKIDKLENKIIQLSKLVLFLALLVIVNLLLTLNSFKSNKMAQLPVFSSQN